MKSRYVQILAPLGGVIFATLVRHSLQPYIGPLFPFFSYFLVIIVCALYGGAIPGSIALFGGYLAGSYFFVSPETSIFPRTTMEWFGAAFYFVNGAVTVILAERQRLARLEARDHAARSEASERALQASIQEIEILNRRLQRAMSETHHRVKNNLQVISAMVDMQTMQESESVPKHELTMIANNIRGLAAIHDLLTEQSTSGGEVDYITVDQAFEKLIPMLQGIACGRPLLYNAGGIRMPSRQGAALIVAVNELVSNAVKHGAGAIEVGLVADDGTGRLTVSDSGRGFPTGFSPSDSGAGLNLVSQLIRWDLRGEIAYQNGLDGGANVVVTFPLAGHPEHELANNGVATKKVENEDSHLALARSF